MAVYTDITDTELADFLAGYDLGEPLVFKGIAEGVENSNFLLETTSGRFFLTVYERRVKADDLPFFLGLMLWLAQRGFPSARPIADREGRLLGRLRGKPATAWPGCTWPARAIRTDGRTTLASPPGARWPRGCRTKPRP